MGVTGVQKRTVALAGNPNVGKSTLFNCLTGLRQHTGNWPGKTVGVARGKCRRGNTEFDLIDLPGTYSLTGGSEDERIAAEFIAEGEKDCTVIVCDGSCLERSLILAIQVLQKTEKCVLCVNLMDEAARNGVFVDKEKLETLINTPVVCTSAGKGEGLETLLETVEQVISQPPRLRLAQWEDPVAEAERLAALCTSRKPKMGDLRRKIDALLVSRRFGIPLVFLLLFFIIWLTVWGANYPSQLLEKGFDRLYGLLSEWSAPAWPWLRGVLLDGVYLTSARVIAVMLPPMAIFFPLFTLLEDMGYLPRMAFLLDGCMARCGGCGKQALTMCMGLGCNAVGVTGCRIIESPRERLAAILTNAMIPCNGRFPGLILLGSLFFGEGGAALAVAGCVLLGAVGAMVASGVLSKTVLRATPSTFLMEMPPFRRPRIGQILVRSLLDRTLFVAGRALSVAAPAGAVLYLASSTGLLGWGAEVLSPVGALLGMNGVILLGFLFALPANELLIPVILMTATGAESLQAVSGLGTEFLRSVMTPSMAVCTMVFAVFHWPCSTTLLTVYRETGSIKNTAAAFFLPTAVGCILCAILNLML